MTELLRKDKFVKFREQLGIVSNFVIEGLSDKLTIIWQTNSCYV